MNILNSYSSHSDDFEAFSENDCIQTAVLSLCECKIAVKVNAKQLYAQGIYLCLFLYTNNSVL